MARAGVANVRFTPWGGIFGPPKMSKEIVDRVVASWAIVLARPEVKGRVRQAGVRTAQFDPQELSAFVAQQLEAYGRGVRAMNLSLD